MRVVSIPVSLLLAGLVTATPAAADGLYLKLAGPTNGVASGQPVRLKLEAVATRSFELGATPEFLVDDGERVRPAAAAEVKALDPKPLAVTPDRPVSREWELTLPAAPGRYKIRARYRVRDRVVTSNRVSVEVAAPKAAGQ
jgi:hypothetical protein